LRIYKADLHIHTLLSPCGDLESTPKAIVDFSSRKGLEIIGIADHNSTLHCELVSFYAKEKGIFTLMGSEITTKEESHCLCFFKDFDSLAIFQNYIDIHLPNILNDSDFFGDQVVIDKDENIIFEEKRMLTSALDVDIESLSKEVGRLEGIFIPSHIDKARNSVISQLGYIPKDLEYDAVEISEYGNKEQIISLHPYLREKTFIRSSDAHFLDKIGSAYTKFEIEELSFEEIKKALKKEEGRRTIL
jgi:PHP family Zn ribbon phosphoesterase